MWDEKCSQYRVVPLGIDSAIFVVELQKGIKSMEPLYSETYLDAKMPQNRRRKRTIMIILCILLPIVDLFILRSALLLFGVVIADALMLVLLPKKQTAFEYIFVDGQIDFDMIVGGEQRKTMQKIDLEKVDVVAPEHSHALDSYQNLPLSDCSSGYDNDQHYIAVFRGEEGNSIRIRFTPDETLLENMKAKARSKIQS